MLREKHERRLDDESIKPLASYRAEELERMKVNFFGPDPAYHEARRRFVFKGAPPPAESRAPILVKAKGASNVSKRGSVVNAGGCQ
jgi:putative two-component system hydrogenase maturation factor HypX/HoxX